MREQAHNYEVNPLPLGFEIVPRDEARPTLTVTVTPQGFWRYNDDNTPWATEIPLYQFYSLVDIASFRLYDSWTSPKIGSTHTPVKLRRWMEKQTAKCLNRRIHDEWTRVLSNFDPKIRDLHKRLFSLSLGKGYWASVKNIIDENNPYLISDVFSYKSAATSLLFDARERWRDDWVYSYTMNDSKYHSLMKTLMNLPNGIIYGMLPQLAYVQLSEPACTRIRLMAYLCLPNGYNVSHSSLEKVIVRSSDDDIKNAIKLMWHYFPNAKTTSGFKSAREIIRAFGLIFDYRGTIGNWDMLGLARRSEQYHHNQEIARRLREEEYARQSAEWQAKQKEKEAKLILASTQLPAVPLPKDEHITFISSYKSVLDEGDLMKHCIAQYGERAVRGTSYLFHVNYKGEMASVEVDPGGFVKQSYGPKDTMNVASEYGKKILNSWAKSLSGKEAPINTTFDEYGRNNFDTPF
jgi:hypothetical protein